MSKSLQWHSLQWRVNLSGKCSFRIHVWLCNVLKLERRNIPYWFFQFLIFSIFLRIKITWKHKSTHLYYKQKPEEKWKKIYTHYTHIPILVPYKRTYSLLATGERVREVGERKENSVWSSLKKFFFCPSPSSPPAVTNHPVEREESPRWEHLWIDALFASDAVWSYAKMMRQENMLQMKEQNKPPVKELHKMEISSLPHAEFKTLVIGCSVISMRTLTKRWNIKMKIENKN